jgi:hypothetical protein
MAAQCLQLNTERKEPAMLQDRHYQCPRCNSCFNACSHPGARWAATGVSALVGGVLTRSLLWTVVIGGVTYWAVGKVDFMLSVRCPNCHEMGQPIPRGVSPIGAEEEAARAA